MKGNDLWFLELERGEPIFHSTVRQEDACYLHFGASSSISELPGNQSDGLSFPSPRLFSARAGKGKEPHGGCQVNGPKVAKFLDR